jgi:hypothetical protein
MTAVAASAWERALSLTPYPKLVHPIGGHCEATES